MADIEPLLNIMKTLRDPQKGCPWDLEQDFNSIAAYTLEEAYEVVDAITRENYEDLQDELGDLQLQVVFHSQMASESGLFDFGDVIKSICDKMIRRHPHVFADTEASSPEDVRKSWQQIKQQEEQKKNQPKASVLDGIPAAMPALKKAQKIGSRAQSIGFDWPHWSGAREKLDEELAEFDEAVESADKKQIQHELGDLLFSIVNLCRHFDVDAEFALGQGCQRFASRFRQVEQHISEQQKTGKKVDLAFMEASWQKAKNK